MDSILAAFDIYNFVVGCFFLSALFLVWLGTSAYIAYLGWLSAKGTHVMATLVGYGKKSNSTNVYYPAFEFTDQFGNTQRAYSDTGSSIFDLNSIGKKVSLSYLPGEPLRVHMNRSFGTYIILGILLVIDVGGYLIADANFNFRPIHFGGSAVGMLAIFYRMGLINAAVQLNKDLRWKLKPASAFALPVGLVPVEELQAIKTSEQKSQREQMSKIPWPLVAAIGFGLLWGSYYTGEKQLHLQRAGQTAVGQIVDYKYEKSGGSNDSGTYHAIVEFTPPNHATVRFKDSLGTSIVSHDKKAVSVLFDPSSPNRAMVDRGFWNWTAPAVLLAFGLLMLLIAEKIWALKNNTVSRLAP